MNSPIQMTLHAGPGIAIPAPREVMESLAKIQVKNNSGDEDSGFELTFNISKRSPLETLFLLTGGSSIPILRVVISVTVKGTLHVLVDGVMTHHQLQPGTNGSATLTVQGKDLTALFDYFDFSGTPFPAMPPAARVALLVAKYAPLGVIPKVIPGIAEDIPLPIERIPQQKGTDLAYIRQLAGEAGYVFYMEPGPVPNVSFAYWGPEIRVGAPQPSLNIDMDAHTNVETLSFRFDKEKKELPITYIHEPTLKTAIPIPIPDITPLNPPLGLIPPLPPKIKNLKYTARLKPVAALMAGIAYAGQHSDSVFGDGTLDVLRYGHVLKSRQLVGVRGAGMAFDGLYYVKSVTHNLERGQYKQGFTLARNGLVSTLPSLPA
ncbi:MAG TPA: hypothetical protein VGO61_03590 [Steroidobacteraceae bacterium]|nr:hypothetical protein [Steroidobacteraceae bacterium]